MKVRLNVLLGEECHDETKRREQSLELQVSPDTPPTFLWHTVTDLIRFRLKIQFYFLRHYEEIMCR